jgi:hypothetical protein
MMKGILLIGVALAILGLVGLAMPVFSTEQTKDVANIGPLHIQANESTPHVVPPLVSGGLLAIGVVLIGAGVLNRG